jgi:CHAD domain-containing protein
MWRARYYTGFIPRCPFRTCVESYILKKAVSDTEAAFSVMSLLFVHSFSHDPFRLDNHCNRDMHSEAMGFVFTCGEPIGEECRRVLREEIAGAVEQLAHFHENPDLAIHETRKHNKRLRATLQLTRPVLDSGEVGAANRLIRDAARIFSVARDALVLQQTLGMLVERFVTESIPSSMAKLERALQLRHDEILNAVDFGDRVDGASQDFVEAGLLLEQWDWSQMSYGIIFSAVMANYRAGISEMETARETRDSEDFHDWRKRAKSLSYQLTLLASLQPDWLEEYALATGELGSFLGEHHDLALFEEAIGDGTGFHLNAKETAEIIDLAQTRRSELETLAFERGREIYHATPDEMHCRLSELVAAKD